MDEIMQRMYLDSVSPLQKSIPSKFEERELLRVQILSMGFNLDDDPDMLDWSNTEMQELLDALVTSAGDNVEAKEAVATVNAADKAEEESATTIPNVTTETHNPGANDLMSGTLPQRRASESSESAPEEFDDPTVSIDTLPRLYRSMPHYMISVKLLKTLNLFNDARAYEALPDSFFTTVKGLKRAWDEANAALPDADQDLDQVLFEAMLKRGGLVENAYWDVKYPGDIVPLKGEGPDLEFWREIREMDWSGEGR